MKCESCGKAMSLEDLRCPACGKINPHAQKHIKDMKRYEGEFQDTKKDVYAVTKKYSQVTSRAIVIVVILILCGAVYFFGANYHSIVRNAAERKAVSNCEEYLAKMDSYLEQEEYLAFNQFVTEKRIDAYDAGKVYLDYLPIIRAVRSYGFMADYLFRLAFPSDHFQVDPTMIGNELTSYYRYTNPEEYIHHDIDWEKCKPALEGLEKHINAMLMTYCHLTEEDMKSIRDLSEARRTVLIEERLDDAKKDME